MSAEKKVQTVRNLFVAISRAIGQHVDTGCRRHRVDHPRQRLAVGWNASRTRLGGGRISDGLRGGADDHFVFATAVLDGKITNIPEYIDTQAALALAAFFAVYGE
ncbi:hypothetical protein [Caballeronia sp. KNU42]